MKSLPITILIMLAASWGSFAASFQEANTFYEQGRYKEAISAYSALLNQNTNSASPNLLFNLGNAQFKNGLPGLALANYRRAAALAPRDPDIQANLRFTRDSLTATYQEPPYTRLLTWFRFGEIATVTTVLWWIALSLATAAVLFPLRRDKLRPGLRLSVALFVMTLLFTLAVYSQTKARTAVFLRETAIRLGPLEESQTAFTLREGAELRMLGRRDQWVQVGDDSRQGWVPAATVAVVP